MEMGAIKVSLSGGDPVYEMRALSKSCSGIHRRVFTAGSHSVTMPCGYHRIYV
jgi:hypothetical protein